MFCKSGSPSSSTWGPLNGYCADITRTYILGPPDEQFRKIYALVRRAQQQPRRGLRPDGQPGGGRPGSGGDCRSGYGEAFGHSLGHGVGLAVHETPP